MLVTQGTERDDVVDRRLACLLAAVAGALNAAAFYDVGFFSANMTGNVSSLSARLALGQWSQAAFYLAIVLAFVVGAMASTLMINAGKRRHRAEIYAIAILVEAILLACLGAGDLCLAGALRVTVVVVGLSFLMGLQNAVVTRISNARVRTTHVSGMATDIGIELGMLLDVLRGRESGEDTALFVSRLRLHSETILFFLIGGIAGVMVYRGIRGYMLWAVAIALFAIALSAMFKVRKT